MTTPSIRTVEIKWSDNPSLPVRSFGSLRAADDAIARAYATDDPLAGRMIDEIGFNVTWSDARTHDGVLHVKASTIELAPARGGVLRGHLEDVARWLRSDRHVRSWQHHYGDRNPTGLAERRAWGLELLRRLTADREAHAASLAPRNIAASGYGGSSAPAPRAQGSASSWLSHLPSPATLLPDPQARYVTLYRSFKEAFDERRIDWTDPRANAFINYLTYALRNDLPRLDAGDAAVIWKRWCDAVAGFREHRAEEGHGDIDHRTLTIARQVGYSLRQPGSVFLSFCPWRSLYFDRDVLGVQPTAAGDKRPRSRGKLDSWRT